MSGDDSRARDIFETILARLRTLTCSDSWAISLVAPSNDQPSLLMKAIKNKTRAPQRTAILRELRRLKLYPPGAADTAMVPDASGVFTPPQISGEYIGANEEDLDDPHLKRAARSPSAIAIESIRARGAKPMRR